ncbi:MAG: hypothetical protein HZB67_01835 [Candidatus Aenigmarchaeota archaeon]|nr:hypothetical protein [Candidatus Aenigmarchaeota archaeon]
MPNLKRIGVYTATGAFLLATGFGLRGFYDGYQRDSRGYAARDDVYLVTGKTLIRKENLHHDDANGYVLELDLISNGGSGKSCKMDFADSTTDLKNAAKRIPTYHLVEIPREKAMHFGVDIIHIANETECKTVNIK